MRCKVVGSNPAIVIKLFVIPDHLFHSRKDCSLWFCLITFYLYWLTTKSAAWDTAKTVAQDSAKTAACVFWITAKPAVCVFLDYCKDCGLCFVELQFYLYWETTKTVARDTVKTAARDSLYVLVYRKDCVLCSEGFYYFYYLYYCFYWFYVKHLVLQFFYEMCYINKVLLGYWYNLLLMLAFFLYNGSQWQPLYQYCKKLWILACWNSRALVTTIPNMGHVRQ